MKIVLPMVNNGGDIAKLFELIRGTELPTVEVDETYLKQRGISESDAPGLLDVLKDLRFIGNDNLATNLWSEYYSRDDRAVVLAAAIQKAYQSLFKEMMCPYLADDETLFDYMKLNVKATPVEMEKQLETFRALCELADFQDLLCDYDQVEPLSEKAKSPESRLPAVKVAPNLQVNLQVHIDPNTPDEKIETIFKNMRKYLLGQE